MNHDKRIKWTDDKMDHAKMDLAKVDLAKMDLDNTISWTTMR